MQAQNPQAPALGADPAAPAAQVIAQAKAAGRSVLGEIVARRRTHLPAIRARLAAALPQVQLPAEGPLSAAQVQAAASTLPRAQRDFYAALGGLEAARRAPGQAFCPRLILECKSASPSKGAIRPDFDPADLARAYAPFAAAISVLCEPDFFGGDFAHLSVVSRATADPCDPSDAAPSSQTPAGQTPTDPAPTGTKQPVLCKDFIIAPEQILLARAHGADAALLMLSVLDDETYRDLAALAESLGMGVLTEVLDEAEMERALKLGARVIDVNHRNLHDLTMDLQRARRLQAAYRQEVAANGSIVVGASGISDAQTLADLAQDLPAFLIGSALSGAADLEVAVRRLVLGELKICGLTSASAARAAWEAGFIYGGLNWVATSPRYLSVSESADLLAGAPQLRYWVVSTASSPAELTALAQDLAALRAQLRQRRAGGDPDLLPALDGVQLHGPLQADEGALLARAREILGTVLGPAAQALRLVRALPTPLLGPADWQNLPAPGPQGPDLYIFDAAVGGSGAVHDWSLIPRELRAKSLLAGGLGVENAAAARASGARGADFNSALEYPPDPGEGGAAGGRRYKDPQKIRAAAAAWQSIGAHLGA